LACGEIGCTQNIECGKGYTCQSIIVDNRKKGICALGENQLFCAANPNVENCCTSQAMPVCANIEMLDANNNLMEKDDDKSLALGDKVRFRCSAVGNQDVDFNYEFRIWNINTNSWIDITDQSNTVAKNVSDLYVIGAFGKHIVQGRICWKNECQMWETVSGAPPSTSTSSTSNTNTGGTSQNGCPEGQILASTPPGGCPIINGQPTLCASEPYCRQAEGINCQSNSDCYDGYFCYQPPMPTCPAGMSCVQVMPSKYCTNKKQ
jgi:hypothetical protein